jgi:lipopolysaccharide export system protein LptC
LTQIDPIYRQGHVPRADGGQMQPSGRLPQGTTARHAGMVFGTGSRSPEEFARAARHSRRVRFLKLALPIGGAASMMIIVAAYLYSLFSLPSIDPGEARVADGKLVMSNPKISGADSNNRPYTLTADRAVQDANNPTRVTLEKIAGKFSIDDDNAADVKAGTGVYDSVKKTLVLSGKVAVDTGDGMSIRMEGASIDIETGRLTTDQPVSVDTGRAQVRSQSLIVEDEGKRIVFDKGVRMTLNPIDPQKAAGAQPN